MTYFSVKENVGQWKPTPHLCRFYFIGLTKVKRQSNDRHPMFPLTVYKFTPFMDVLNSPNVDGPDLIGDSKGVATSFRVSKLLLDEHIPEVEEFHIRFLSMRTSPLQPSGQLSSSSGISSTKEVRGCWFYGEISSILSWKSWAYPKCYDPTCFKKVIKDNGEFVCTNCETQFLEGVWLYSLRLRVKHRRSYADLMLWDGKNQRLIGKAAGKFPDHIDMTISTKELSRGDIPLGWAGSCF